MANNKNNDLWLTFMLKDTLYAINVEYVKAILTKPKDITSIPKSAPFVKGLISLGDNLVTLLSLRELFDLTSLSDELNEFVQMLHDRKNDHIEWVKALEDSVKNNTEFTLATNPHKCKFGKWYYDYEPVSPTIAMHLKKIEKPHKILHETALEIKKLKSLSYKNKSNEHEIDMLLRKISKQLMPKTLRLIDDVINAFEEAHREIAVILRYENDESFGIIFDDVIKLEALEILSENNEELKCENEYVKGIAKRPNDEGLVLTVDVPAVITKSRNKIKNLSI